MDITDELEYIDWLIWWIDFGRFQAKVGDVIEVVGCEEISAEDLLRE